ncbi:ATP-dependent RNA helicase [Achlya hypogyna]|uniref:RNA helicase n=1 Tax=Achlya hypogyna TaxID=1202772 RepID=A0A1V9Z643_ACHHY|nr:ATP-dependent RNA helicase [Achlya hypogyna]
MSVLQRLDLSEKAEARLAELLAPTLQLPETKAQFRSGRRTLKKIEKAYDTLVELGLPMELIEEALCHTHDTTGALQYLCLYYPSSELPSRFRANVPKPPTDGAALEVVAAPQRDETSPENTAAATLAPNPSADGPSLAEMKAKEASETAKAWTLRYLEKQAQAGDSDEDEDSDDQASPETRMWKLEVACAASVVEAQRAKRFGGNIKHWNAEIARLRREMRELEPYVDRANMAPLPQPAFIATDATDATNATDASDTTVDAADGEGSEDDDDGGLFGMLEEAAPVAIAAPVVAARVQVDTSSGAKWTGKSPRLQLQEYCQKLKWPAPRYSQEHEWGRYNFSVAVTTSARAKGSAAVRTVVLRDIIFATLDGAKDAVATRALYELAPHLPMHRGLPPYFRDMWLEWERVKAAATTATHAASKQSKAAIVDRLFALCKDGGGPPPAVAATSAPPTLAAPLDSWDDDLDDWEDAAPPALAPPPAAVDTALQRQWARCTQSTKYQAFAAGRAALPMAAFRRPLLDALATNAVVLVSGETGCGKSTQVPHFLLDSLLAAGDANGSIVCTQPRRIAAIGVADRVATEMGQVVGDGYVGYSIRLETKKSAACRLLFCTTGVLLRRLQGDPALTGVSHVIVDEIHERDVQSDVLLALLRRLLRQGAPLKVVLMSATLNAVQFQRYFEGCPLLEVPGRLFPVAVHYLEDVIEATGHIVHDGDRTCKASAGGAQQAKVVVSGRGGRSNQVTLAWSARDVDAPALAALGDGYSTHTRETLAKVDPSVINYELLEELIASLVLGPTGHVGAILVFLSGRGEIRSLLAQLQGNRRLAAACEVLPLHASLSAAEQQRIFRTYPGKTKVIASTNLAETSLTIDDVTVVIDAGRVKHMRHDVKTQTSSLLETWIAQANANQRAGRAGRVQPGTCYRLYPRATFERELPAQPIAEIHRAPLTSLALQLHALVGSAASFWAELLEAPAPAAIEDATQELRRLGALDAADSLTPLGRHLSALPLDARTGKLLLFGAIFGCAAPVAVVAALLETKSPFAVPFGAEADARARRAQFATAQSDLLTDLAAFRGWQAARDRAAFCRANYLQPAALDEVRRLAASFEEMLVQLRFLPPTYAVDAQAANRYADANAVVAAVVAAGLYPNVLDVQVDAHGVVRLWEKKKQVHLHPSSVNHGAGRFHTPWLGYHLKLQTSRVFVPVTSSITPYALALFGGTVDVDLLAADAALVVDGWLPVPASARTAMLVLELRKCLSDLLQRKIDTPGADDALARDAVDAMALLWMDEAKSLA